MTTETLSRFSRITAADGYVITDGTTYAKVACAPLGTEDNWSECEPPAEEEETAEETETAEEEE